MTFNKIYEINKTENQGQRKQRLQMYHHKGELIAMTGPHI